ncbi:hypothetical protein [Campylobacter sp. RM15925]|uniref:hypothetical protein n=1 Tax=Campylobacter sp. RM15925 TaxID=1705724 RepID=UPI0014734493|nr:hypothetical protein [Campylobacter sp. RM15925]
MLEYFKANIISIVIGVSGFLSAIVTLFINLNDLISIKWLVFVIFIFLVTVSILVGYLYDIKKDTTDYSFIKKLKLKPLYKNVKGNELFVNNSSIELTYNDIIKLYFINSENIEVFVGIGIIRHVQSDNRICHIKFLYRIDKAIPKQYNSSLYFSLQLKESDIKDVLNLQGEN